MNEERGLPTSDEIDQRLRMVSELRNLCLSLGRVRRIEAPASSAPPPAVDATAPAPHSAPSVDG